MNWPWQVWCSVERQLSINTWPAAPGPVPEWKNERISSACGTQISSEAIYAPGVRQQAAETSANLSSIGLADDRLNRIVQIYGLTPLMILMQQRVKNPRFGLPAQLLDLQRLQFAQRAGNRIVRVRKTPDLFVTHAVGRKASARGSATNPRSSSLSSKERAAMSLIWPVRLRQFQTWHSSRESRYRLQSGWVASNPRTCPNSAAPICRP